MKSIRQPKLFIFALAYNTWSGRSLQTLRKLTHIGEINFSKVSSLHPREANTAFVQHASTDRLNSLEGVASQTNLNQHLMDAFALRKASHLANLPGMAASQRRDLRFAASVSSAAVSPWGLGAGRSLFSNMSKCVCTRRGCCALSLVAELIERWLCQILALARVPSTLQKWRQAVAWTRKLEPLGTSLCARPCAYIRNNSAQFTNMNRKLHHDMCRLFVVGS